MTNTAPERLLALIAQWEYQCCGEPIEVGTTVELTITYLETPLPGPGGQRIELSVEHHIPSDPMKHVRARVLRLWEWRFRREDRHGDGTLYPIADTEEYTPIRRMEVWDENWQPNSSIATPEGWAVELEVLSLLEPKPDGSPYGV